MRVIETDSTGAKPVNKTQTAQIDDWQATDGESSLAADRLTASRNELTRVFLAQSLAGEGLSLKAFMDELERNLILQALTVSAGVQKRAATLLKVKPTALSEKIKKYGITINKDKKNGYQRSVLEAAFLLGWSGNSENKKETRNSRRS